MKTKYLLCLIALLPAFSMAKFQSEELQTSITPKGFVQGYKNTQGNSTIIEMVPKGESVQNWNKMITFTIMRNPAPDVNQMRELMSSGWQSACPGGQVHPINASTDASFPTTYWMMSCPNNPQTGKPEVTAVKAIRGNGALYTVQFAFRHIPSDQEWKGAILYLTSVGVK